MFNSNTRNELIFTHYEAIQVLKEWFNSLQNRDYRQSFNGRAWRAELRRVKDPYEVIPQEGFHYLLQKLKAKMKLENIDLFALAIFVTVCVHVRNHKGDKSFAAQLGEEIKGRPCLSQLRFNRLQQASQPEELSNQLVRAVKLRGDAGVNIISLADGIFLWMHEWQTRQEQYSINPNPFKRNTVRWASEYLSASE